MPTSPQPEENQPDADTPENAQPDNAQSVDAPSFDKKGKEKHPAVRTDLLEPAEAWVECKKRMANVLPDLPAFALVIIFGALGACIGCAWHLALPLGQGRAAYDFGKIIPHALAVALGVSGAVAAVFLLAKTDTSKLIHCSLVALFSGMIGPVLVLKALTTIADIKPEDLVPSQLASSESSAKSAATTSKDLSLSFDKGNPATAVQQVTKVKEQAKDSLAAYQEIVTVDPKAAKAAAESIEKPLQETLGNLEKVLPQSEDAVLAVQEIKNAATKAGANAVLKKAQEVIDAGAKNPAVQKLFERVNAPIVCLITPPELGDEELAQIKAQLLELFPSWKFKAVIHPQRTMDDGIEIVYYNRSEADEAANQRAAQKAGEYLKSYFRTSQVAIRRGGLPDGENRTQFDLHIGPDVARNFKKPNSASITPIPASPAPAQPPHKRK